MAKNESFIKQAFKYASPYLLLVIVGVQVMTSVSDSIDHAAYAYPRSVVQYGLTDVKTDAEVMARIEQWKSDAWGAQIGALRVLCARDPDFVASLTATQSASAVCRVGR